MTKESEISEVLKLLREAGMRLASLAVEYVDVTEAVGSIHDAISTVELIPVQAEAAKDFTIQQLERVVTNVRYERDRLLKRLKWQTGSVPTTGLYIVKLYSHMPPHPAYLDGGYDPKCFAWLGPLPEEPKEVVKNEQA